MPRFEYRQVLGPFNSGTSLMNRYLNQLLARQPGGQPFLWKHSVPPHWLAAKKWRQVLRGFPDYLDMIAPTRFVCMVRLPYFWAWSTLRRSYSLVIDAPVNDFSASLRARVSLKGVDYDNVFDLWNNYYYRYLELAAAGVHEFHLVRLEDLIAQPRATLEPLLEGMKPKENADLAEAIGRIPANPSKRYNIHGQEWLDTYRTENISRYIPAEDIDYINSQLDLDLVSELGYRPLWSRPGIS